MPEKEESRTKRRAEELYDLVKSGDQRAYELLFAVFFARLNDFARRVIRDEMVSQDIVQEVFVTLWVNREKIVSANVEGFLFRAVRNRCLDYIKHLKVVSNSIHQITLSSEYEELYRIDFVGNEPYVLIEKELEMKIQETIRGLPERCRDVFILSRVKGLKNREIAAELQISIKNVERHLSRAMQAFTRNFGDALPVAVLVMLLKEI